MQVSGAVSPHSFVLHCKPNCYAIEYIVLQPKMDLKCPRFQPAPQLCSCHQIVKLQTASDSAALFFSLVNSKLSIAAKQPFRCKCD